MSTEMLPNLKGNNFEIIEMNLINLDNRLDLFWKVCCDNKILSMSFYNVSRLKIEDFSAPVEIHGLEIIDHSSSGWDKDSKYEIRDYEYDSVNFFCESFKIITL